MTNNLSKMALVVVGLALAGAALYLYRPIVLKNATTVTVTGEANEEIAPDRAVVTFAVFTQNALAVTAQNANSKRLEEVLKALEAASGGATQTVETSSYSLNPQTEWVGERQKVVGYEARNAITVTTDKLDQVGALMDAATKAGANEVEGVRFTVREDSTRRGDALGLATRQAMAKAESIATSLGGRIVRVIQTVESGATPPAIQNDFEYKSAANAAVPIRPAAVKMRGQVSLTVEIEVKR